MPSFASGNSSCTAWAMTCAVECRKSARPAVVPASTTCSRPARVMCSLSAGTGVLLGGARWYRRRPPPVPRCYRCLASPVPALQANRPAALDDLLEGNRRLAPRALAVGIAGAEGQDAETVPAMAADARVLAGTVPQLVLAVLADREQAGPWVEALRAVTLEMPDLEAAVAELEGVGPVAKGVHGRAGEHSVGDHAASLGGRRCGHELEVLGTGSRGAGCGVGGASRRLRGVPCGRAGARRGQPADGNGPRGHDHARGRRQPFPVVQHGGSSCRVAGRSLPPCRAGRSLAR